MKKPLGYVRYALTMSKLDMRFLISENKRLTVENEIEG